MTVCQYCKRKIEPDERPVKGSDWLTVFWIHTKTQTMWCDINNSFNKHYAKPKEETR